MRPTSRWQGVFSSWLPLLLPTLLYSEGTCVLLVRSPEEAVCGSEVELVRRTWRQCWG